MKDWKFIKTHLIKVDEKMESLIQQFGISPFAKKVDEKK